MNEALLSSKTGEWSTPQDFFDRLDWKYHFTLDAAATAENAKCARFFTAEDDGLSKNWGGADRILQSAVWPGDRALGAQRLRGIKGRRGGYAAARQDGHALVSRLLHEGKDHIPAGAAEIRRSQGRRTVPVYAGRV